LLRGLSAAGVAFTLWLTYAEVFLIHALCRWCLGSAGIMSLIFGVAWFGLRREAAPAA
jgi:uncharacterized membrane protein